MDTDFHGFFLRVESHTGSGFDFVEARLDTDKALFLISERMDTELDNEARRSY